MLVVLDWGLHVAGLLDLLEVSTCIRSGMIRARVLLKSDLRLRGRSSAAWGHLVADSSLDLGHFG